MDFETVKTWFERWAAKQANNSRLKGILGFCLMPMALLAALTLVFWVLKLFTHDASGNLGNTSKCLWMTLAVLPLMFVGNKIVPRRNLMEERMSDGINEFYAHSSVNRGVVVGHVFLWILFTGPRLCDWGLDSFRAASAWRTLDAHSCAAVLWVLINRGRKASFEEIHQEADWLEFSTVLPQLKRISGVLFLQGPPPGLTLAPEFREAIKSLQV